MGQSCLCLKLISAMFLIIFTNTILFNNIGNPSNKQKSNIHASDQFVKISMFENHNYRSSTVLGGYELSVNKAQKIINGNRRSVGYKLAVWNCGRGLVKDGFSQLNNS